MIVEVLHERQADIAAVRSINERAFGGLVEAQIVDRLRGCAGSISLVAIVKSRVVGHIFFTPVEVEGIEAEKAFAGLGPMAVDPDSQRLGIGSALVRRGLRECESLGYGLVVVVGHPEFYPRFGFVPAASKGLRFERDVPAEAFMALELGADTFTGSTGVVKYHPEFWTV